MKFAVPGWFDACLTLYDADGNWLAYADDFRFHPDPVLSYKVPKDGEYLLEIRDVLHRGGHDYIYRLRMGALPFVTHVFPLGGRRGTEVDLELHGVNLSAEKLRWKVPADGAEAQTTGVRDGKSNGLPLAAGDLPETTEVEPNDSSAKAQRVTLPITINGRIQTSGDEDYFVFKVEEGQKLVMEVNARCLDSPLDSVLTLFDAAGRKLAEDDDPVPQGVRAENVVEARVENDRSFHTEPRDALTDAHGGLAPGLHVRQGGRLRRAHSRRAGPRRRRIRLPADHRPRPPGLRASHPYRRPARGTGKQRGPCGQRAKEERLRRRNPTGRRRSAAGRDGQRGRLSAQGQ